MCGSFTKPRNTVAKELYNCTGVDKVVQIVFQLFGKLITVNPKKIKYADLYAKGIIETVKTKLSKI